jgi:hypothetical protein
MNVATMGTGPSTAPNTNAPPATTLPLDTINQDAQNIPVPNAENSSPTTTLETALPPLDGTQKYHETENSQGQETLLTKMTTLNLMETMPMQTNVKNQLETIDDEVQEFFNSIDDDEIFKAIPDNTFEGPPHSVPNSTWKTSTSWDETPWDGEDCFTPLDEEANTWNGTPWDVYDELHNSPPGREEEEAAFEEVHAEELRNHRNTNTTIEHNYEPEDFEYDYEPEAIANMTGEPFF